MLLLRSPLFQLEISQVLFELLPVAVLLPAHERIIGILLIVLTELFEQVFEISRFLLLDLPIQHLEGLVVGRLCCRWLTLINEPVATAAR